MQLTAYFLSWPWFATLPIMLAVRELHLVEHNHAHLPIFRQAMLNEILGWLCFISNGVPLECYELHHVQNHHRYTQQFNDNARDWSSTFGFTGTHYPDKPIGRTYYCASYALLAWLHCWIEVLRRPGSPVFRRFMRSYFLCIGISAALLIIDPWNYFLFFAIPWAMVYIGIGSNNYDHHQNCKLTTPYNSANVDLRFPYRLFGFNIGYHVEHHMKPTLHWSLLPEYHDLIKKDIPPDNYVIKPPA
ncbi:MAG TPA: fatty acid desaturase [Blastocatellia bacterium]|nr:fatty acid desaturase [Blastocatellia bacterium]